MTMERSFEIREARRADVPALAALHVAAFKEAHGQRGAPNYELRKAQWRPTFERGMNWFCYVAEAPDGQLVDLPKASCTTAACRASRGNWTRYTFCVRGTVPESVVPSSSRSRAASSRKVWARCCCLAMPGIPRMRLTSG